MINAALLIALHTRPDLHAWPEPLSFLGLWFTFLCPPLMAVCVMVMMRQRRAAQVGEDRA
ncbi:MAG: hypothetical protein LCH41_12315 [Armatimonadetes bacterium]|nr:hypothetical protein [Armatimonadota bacterium]